MEMIWFLHYWINILRYFRLHFAISNHTPRLFCVQYCLVKHKKLHRWIAVSKKFNNTYICVNERCETVRSCKMSRNYYVWNEYIAVFENVFSILLVTLLDCGKKKGPRGGTLSKHRHRCSIYNKGRTMHQLHKNLLWQVMTIVTSLPKGFNFFLLILFGFYFHTQDWS